MDAGLYCRLFLESVPIAWNYQINPTHDSSVMNFLFFCALAFSKLIPTHINLLVGAIDQVRFPGDFHLRTANINVPARRSSVGYNHQGVLWFRGVGP